MEFELFWELVSGTKEFGILYDELLKSSGIKYSE